MVSTVVCLVEQVDFAALLNYSSFNWGASVILCFCISQSPVVGRQWKRLPRQTALLFPLCNYMPDFAGVPFTEIISFSEAHQGWHYNNNTRIGGTGKAIRYPMFIKFVAGLRQQLDQQRLVQIFTSCRHHIILSVMA